MTTNSFLLHLIFFLLLTAVASCVTWFFYKTAITVDQPNHRSSHLHTTPRSGGVAIVVTFFIGMLIIFYFGDATHIEHRHVAGFLGSSLLVALLAFLDDLQRIRVSLKFAVMTVAIGIAIWGGILLDHLFIPGFGDMSFGWFAYPLTFLWILGLTNAVNFMDGLDGLIGGTAAIVSLFFMIITFSQGSTFVYITCYTILAGSIGFLFFNFPPAKIFMGDVGSVFLGFVFAMLAIIAARYDHSHTSFLVMPLLLFHVIFDTFFTFSRRLLRGENVTQAHRSHLYQLVQRMGFTHLAVSLMQYGFCFLQGLGACWLVQVQGNQRLAVFLPFLLFQAAYAFVVIRMARERELL